MTIADKPINLTYDKINTLGNNFEFRSVLIYPIDLFIKPYHKAYVIVMHSKNQIAFCELLTVDLVFKTPGRSHLFLIR